MVQLDGYQQSTLDICAWSRNWMSTSIIYVYSESVENENDQLASEK